MTATDVPEQGDQPDGDPISPVRLHGEACIECGDTTSELVPAGHRHTSAGHGKAPYGWAVKACPTHAPKVTR